MTAKPSYEELKKRVAALEAQVRHFSEAQGEIKRSRNFLDSLLKSIPTPVFWKDTNGRYQGCNPAFTEIMGVNSEQMSGKTVYELWPSEHAKFYHQKDLELIQNPQQQTYDFEVQDKDGSRRPVVYQKNVFRDEDGTIIGLVGSFVDISKILQAQQEIIRRQKFLESVLYHAPDAIITLDEHQRVMDWNPGAVEMFGYKPEEAIGVQLDDLLVPNRHHAEATTKVSHLLSGQRVEAFETVRYRKDGSPVNVMAAGSPILVEGTLKGVVTVYTDISERVRNEKVHRETFEIIAKSPVAALQESEKRFRQIASTVKERNAQLITINEELKAEIDERRRAERRQSAILENIPDIAWLKDRDSRFIAVNEQFAKACGWTAADLVGKNDLDIWPREMAERYRADDAEVMETARRKTVEEPLSDVSGETKWIETIKTPIFDYHGKLIGTTGIARDITKRRQLEQDLIEEKGRLTVTLRSIGDAVITTDRDGRIVLINLIAEQLTGWSEAEAVGRQLMDVLRIENEQTGEPCGSPVEKVLASGHIVGLANHTVLIARDGKRYTIAESGAPIADTNGETIGVVLVFRDITNQQRLEKELLKMEKLKSLGVLAGGIAHDFNNFLTGILGNLSLAKMDMQPGNPVSRSLNEIEKAAVRAKDLTQQLLTFSKGGEPVKRTTDITKLVREAAQFALHGSNVQNKFDIDDKLMPVDVDGGQIAQVIHNLIINAYQAMPNGGMVWIQGANVSLAKGNPFALSPGNYIQVTVKDQGMGIHPNYIKKVFDPYFTTKQKGSGLGLAVAYNIVAKHDGQLTVDSELGVGTSFTILLPSTTISPKTFSEKRDAIVTGQGRILVMDDEDYIRELALSMLTKLGYEVEVAEGGQTAVDLYQMALDKGRPFDAVILDLTVPGGMGGKETIKRLNEIDKNVQAIVSSGYSNDPVMANYTHYGFRGAVQKPYLVQQMSQVIKTVIKKN